MAVADSVFEQPARGPPGAGTGLPSGRGSECVERRGSRHAPEGCVYTDRATGQTVRQLTDHPSINHPTYFLQSSFTPDGKALVFTSYRSGSAQLFEASFPDGEIRQLTEGPAIHPFS